MTKESATMSKVLTILEAMKQEACDEIRDNGPESRDNIPVIAQRDLLVELKRIFSDKETINLHFNMAVRGEPKSLTVSSIEMDADSEQIAPKIPNKLDGLIHRLDEWTTYDMADGLLPDDRTMLEEVIKVLKIVRNFLYE